VSLAIEVRQGSRWDTAGAFSQGRRCEKAVIVPRGKRRGEKGVIRGPRHGDGETVMRAWTAVEQCQIEGCRVDDATLD
jgi:hypothetical protein